MDGADAEEAEGRVVGGEEDGEGVLGGKMRVRGSNRGGVAYIVAWGLIRC